jgi:SAM-dependent methyltransferase
MRTHFVFVAFIALAPALAAAQTSQPEPRASVRMRSEAEALRLLVATSLGKAFLDAAANLPAIEPRTIYRNEQTTLYLSASQAKQAQAADPNLKLREIAIDEVRYYDTKYGTPMAYARPFDLLGEAGVHDFDNLKILDFGYGTIGHLRMLASSGADVTGLDVDSFLTALYSEPTDTGPIETPTGKPGSITLVDGRFSDAKVKDQAGSGYDLIISKNTLKRGYIHPPPNVQVDKRVLVDLGVDDETFLRTLFDALKPGGHVLIYNLSPKQADYEHGEKFIPWADGRCPFEKELIEKVGFRTLIYDQDDSKAAREMARSLKWDQGQGAMDLDSDLFAHFTLLQKPAK